MTQAPMLPILELDIHARLCEKIFDQFVCIAVVSADPINSQFSAAAADFPGFEDALITKAHELEPTELETGTGFSLQHAGKDSGSNIDFRVFARSIEDVHEQPLGTLLVVTVEQLPRQDARQLLFLDIVHSAVANECLVGLELDTVISELTDRYEELNLIYGTDDNSESFNQLHQVLGNLVQQCWERMDVSAAALYLPEQGICIVEEDGVPAGATQPIEKYLDEELLHWVNSIGATFVSNTSEEADANKHCPELQRKLICSPITKPSGAVTGFISVFNGYDRPDFSNSDRNLIEILARKASRVFNSNYDELTGLVKKASFNSIVEDLLRSVQPEEEGIGSLLLIELRNIHMINDTLGAEAGDALIKTAARLFLAELGDAAVVGRLDGKVFGVMLPACTISAAESIAQELLHKVSHFDFQWQEQETQISVNMGLVQICADMDAESQLANAKIALNVAAEKGVNVLEIQRPESDDIAKRRQRILMLSLINDTLKHDRFELYAQGIFASDRRDKPHHYEILLRYRDSEGHIKAPFPMIEAAEFYKVMPDIDRWVIRKAISTLGEHWHQLERSGIGWAINLSGQTFAQNGLMEYISAELAKSAVCNKEVAFEVTETVAINNLAAARETVQKIKELGCEFYLDDFGTGLSSFTYLMELPFDYVKIDGSFVKKIAEDQVSRAMVQAISDVASTLDMSTVAEFVENDEIADILQSLGINFLQGYGLHQPEPLSEIIKRLSDMSSETAAPNTGAAGS